MASLKAFTKKLKDGTEVILCSPQPGDGAEILSVMTPVMAESKYLLTEIEEFTYTAEQEEEMIKTFLDHPNKIIITPKINNKIVGMLDFVGGTRRRIQHQGMFGMSVATAHQGKGIGRLMIEALVDWATKETSLETLRLEVSSDNIQATSLYKKSGFVEEGRRIKQFKFKDGTYNDIVLMTRQIK